MDDLRTQINDAVKAAMVARDTVRRDVLRLMQSALKQVEVDERRALTDDDVLKVLQKEVKKRRESADEARKVGRDDIANGEETEIAIIQQFLPQQLSRAEIEALAREAIATTGAASAKDIGKVMGVLSPKTKNVADGKLVNEVVRSLLGS